MAAALDDEGADPADAFQVLYGLVIQDLQIRVLLGEAPLPPRPSPPRPGRR